MKLINRKGEVKLDKSGNTVGARNTKLHKAEQKVPCALKGKTQCNTKVNAELVLDLGEPLLICTNL